MGRAWRCFAITPCLSSDCYRNWSGGRRHFSGHAEDRVEGGGPLCHSLAREVKPGSGTPRGYYVQGPAPCRTGSLGIHRSEEHTSELQSLMHNSYAAYFYEK